MKNLLMIVALVGIVFTGYSKPNDSSTDAQAQKPTITLSVSGSGFSKIITLHASQPVPETVICEGQFQAPYSETGYWARTLNVGETSVSGSSTITEDNLVDITKVIVGGKSFNADIDSGPFETANAIYYVNH